MPELIRVIINSAMQAEHTGYLNAEPYQHIAERQGHANGYKPKTMWTRVGEITFAIPVLATWLIRRELRGKKGFRAILLY